MKKQLVGQWNIFLPIPHTTARLIWGMWKMHYHSEMALVYIPILCPFGHSFSPISGSFFNILFCISLDAQQNDVNAHIVLPRVIESSFCQVYVFEVLTPTSTYRQFIIYMFYLLNFP